MFLITAQVEHMHNVITLKWCSCMALQHVAQCTLLLSVVTQMIAWMPATAVARESASTTWVLPGLGNSASAMLVSLETTAKKVWVCRISEDPV